MAKILFPLYQLVLSLWVGGIAIFTFLVTPAVFKSFDRDTASRVVDSFMGKYFAWNLVLSVSALILILSLRNMLPGGYKLPLAIATLAVLITAFTAFGLYPRIREVKRQIVSFETAPKDSEARKRFSRLHAVSMVLNVILLADGAVLLVTSGCLKK